MNKKTRVIIVSTLIFALVLSMVGCSSDVLGGGSDTAYEVSTPAISEEVAAPTVATSETPIEQAEIVISETAIQVVDTDEAQLALYGITFPTFDNLVYTDDIDEMAESMSFGVDIDQFNLYQEAYDFEITAKITAVDFEGNSLTKTKYAADPEYVEKYIVDYDTFDLDTYMGYIAMGYKYNYYDANNISSWTGAEYDMMYMFIESEQYYFTVGRAGIYTVEYTVEIEFEDEEYGYLVPDELEEKYTITKTYTVEKAELNLETVSDAFQVDSSMFFVDSVISLSEEEEAALEDAEYSTSVEVTSCDGTEVGEYKLSITIKDDDDNVVDPSDIVLSNYYVTVTEGTRYILSAEDVAKANAVRKMYYDNFVNGKTSEYEQEIADYYNSLTDGQKILAAVDISEDSEYGEKSRLEKYLVVDTAVSEDDIKELEYNAERADLVTEIEDLIDAYMTASTDRVKDDYLTELAITLQLIDNEGHEFGSDVLYALGQLVTGVYVPAGAEGVSGYFTYDEFEYAIAVDDDITYTYGYMTFEEVEEAGISESYYYYGYLGVPNEVGFATKFDIEDTNTIYAIVIEGVNAPYYMVSFKSEYDEETETYSVDFDYAYSYEEVDTSLMDDMGSNYTPFYVNDIYDAYLYEYAVDGMAFMKVIYSYMMGMDFDSDGDEESGTRYIYSQAKIDTLTDAVDEVVSARSNLLDYQTEYGYFGVVSFEYTTDYFLAWAQEYVDRWDAYVEFVESFEFEYSYIDNAYQEDLSATYLAVQQLFGYTFVNSNLYADATVEGSLAETLFVATAYNEYFNFGLATPTLFVEDIFSAYGDIVDILQTIQAETDLVKQELINYIVSTGYYSSNFNNASGDDHSVEDYDSYYISYADYLEDAALLYGENGGYKLYIYSILYTYENNGGSESESILYAFTSSQGTESADIAESAEIEAVVNEYLAELEKEGISNDSVEYTYNGEFTYDTSADLAGCLDDLLAWVDYQVLAEMLYEDSSFWKNYSKKGIDEAMNEMFEGIIEDAQDRVDDMVTDIKNASAKTADYYSGGSSINYEIKADYEWIEDNNIAISNSEITIALDKDGNITFNGGASSDVIGEKFTAKAVLTYSDEWAFLGLVETTFTVTIKASALE